MNTAQTIAKNTSVLLISDIISKVSMLFYIMFTARYLGASGFGILAFAIAFTGLFAILTDMGLGTLTTREVAKDKSLAGKYVNNLLSIKLILTAATFGLIVLTINLMDYPDQTVIVVYITGVAVICMAFTQVFNSLFQAFERMEYISICTIIHAVATLGGALLVIHLGFGVIGFAIVYLISNALMLGYIFLVFTTKFLVPKLNLEFSFWKWTVKEGWPFGLFSIVASIATRIDVVMLSAMKGDQVVGWYQAAVGIVVTLQFIPSAVINSFFPKLSEYYGDNELLEKLAQKMNRILFAIALLLTMGTFVFASRVIPLIYGGGFNESIILLQILSVYLFVTYIPADGVVLNAIHKQKLKFYAGVAMVITNVILNLIFIPKYGAIAAACTTIFSYIVLRVFYITFVRFQGLKTFTPDRSILMITIMGILIGYIFTYVLDGLNLFLSIFLCTGLYLAIVYFWFAKSDEKEFINNYLYLVIKSIMTYLNKFLAGIRNRGKG